MVHKISILIFLCSNFFAAQNPGTSISSFKKTTELTKTEKLEVQLRESKKENLHKVNIYRKLCREYIDVDNIKLSNNAKEMLRISEQLNDDNGKADAYNFLGIVEDINSHFEKAMLYYKIALPLAYSSKNAKLLASIGNNIGLLEWKKGNFKEALSYFFTSLKSAEKVGSLKLQGNIASNIGLVFQDLNQFEENLKWQKKALSIRSKNEDNYGLASTFTNIASAYSFLNKSDSSIYFQNKAISIQRSIEDDYGLGISYFNLGNEYQKNDQTNEAIKLYNFSKSIREKIEDSLGLSFTYISLASSKLKTGNTTEAILYGERSLAIAKKIKSPERIAENSKELSEIYEKIGESDKALKLMKQYISYHDDIFNKEMNDKVADLNIKYEVEKKEKDLSNANLQVAESNLRSKQKNIFLSIVAGIFIIGLIVFKNYRTKSILQKKQLALENALLQEQSYSKIQEQRLEISRDLHDSLGAQLTLMSSVLDGLQRDRGLIDQKFFKKIDILSEFSESSIAELKNALWVLYSDVIYVEDLKFKMLNFLKNAADAKDALDIDFSFKIDDNNELNSKMAANIFRVFQEILNNAIKYSNATKIKIDIQKISKILSLQISDNGIGFDLDLQKEKSFGLHNIESRIKNMDGDLFLETSCGKGVVYLIKINL